MGRTVAASSSSGGYENHLAHSHTTLTCLCLHFTPHQCRCLTSPFLSLTKATVIRFRVPPTPKKTSRSAETLFSFFSFLPCKMMFLVCLFCVVPKFEHEVLALVYPQTLLSFSLYFFFEIGSH